VATASPTGQDENPLDPVKVPLETERENVESFILKKSFQRTTTSVSGPKRFISGSLLPDNVLSPNKSVGNGER